MNVFIHDNISKSYIVYWRPNKVGNEMQAADVGWLCRCCAGAVQMLCRCCTGGMCSQGNSCLGQHFVVINV